MTFDYERKAHKASELTTLLEQWLPNHLDGSNRLALARQLLNVFAEIAPPKHEHVYVELVTARSFSGRGGGRSSKPGNIQLNIRSLFEAVANGTFTVVSAAEAPWALPFAAILLWNSVWKAAQVELTQNEVAILWTMWGIRDREKYVAHPKLLEAVNQHMARHSLTAMWPASTILSDQRQLS